MIDDWKGKPYCSMIYTNCIYPEKPGEGKRCLQCEHFPVKDKLKFAEPFDYEASMRRSLDRLYEIGIGRIWMHFEDQEPKRFIFCLKNKT